MVWTSAQSQVDKQDAHAHVGICPITTEYHRNLPAGAAGPERKVNPLRFLVTCDWLCVGNGCDTWFIINDVLHPHEHVGTTAHTINTKVETNCQPKSNSKVGHAVSRCLGKGGAVERCVHLQPYAGTDWLRAG